MDSIDTDTLEELGYKLMHSKEDRNGQTIHLIETPAGENVAMLESDIGELIRGETTVRDIMEQQRDANMVARWPTITKLPPGGSVVEDE